MVDPSLEGAFTGMVLLKGALLRCGGVANGSQQTAVSGARYIRSITPIPSKERPVSIVLAVMSQS